MKYQKLFIPILLVILCIIILPNVLAISYFDSNGVTTWTNASSVTACGNVIINTSNAINLTAVSTVGGDSANHFVIFNGTPNTGSGGQNCTQISGAPIITQGNVVNNIGNITNGIILLPGKNYTIGFDGSRTMTYETTPLLPHTGNSSGSIIKYLASYNVGTGIDNYTRDLYGIYYSTVNNIFPVNITFLNTTINDITSTNLFTNNLSITYQYNITGLIVPYLVTYINSSILSCSFIQNGSCVISNKGINTISGNNNTINNVFNISENSVYPRTQNIDVTISSINVLNISNSNNYVADSYFNISNNISFNFYEFEYNGTGTVNIYLFNSSYDFNSNPSTNNNVHLLCVINSTNHFHSSSNWDSLCAFNVNSSGFTDTLKVTSTGGFIINYLNGIVNLQGYNTEVRQGVTKLSTNNGNSWTNKSITLRSHLHQFSGSDTFCYYGAGNWTTGINPQVSNIICDNLDITKQIPTIPNILVPNISSSFNSRFINITYQASVPTVLGSSIIYYNISLLNNDFSFNSTLQSNNSLNTSFNWDSLTSNLNTSLNYYISITAYDNWSQTSTSISNLFNVTINSQLNITAKLVNGTSINNFYINVFDNTNNVLYGIYNTSTGNVTVLIVKNINYTYVINASNSAYSNITIINTNSTNSYQFILFTTNSVNITIYDENSRGIIYQPTIIQLVGTYQQYNFTVNGTNYFDLLSPDTYNVLTSINGYFARNYVITVINGYTQSLNIFLLNSTINNNIQTVFLIKSQSGNALSNVLITTQILTDKTYTTLESRYTDISGQAKFSFDSTRFYRITESINGYVTKVYQLQPISTSYTDILSSNNIISNNVAVSNVSYYTFPNSTYLLPTNITYSFITSSSSASILWFAINVNGTTQNITTSNTGGTAQIIVNYPSSNFSKTELVTYYIFTTNGYTTFSNYYVISNLNNTYSNSITTGDDDSGLSTGGKIIFGTLILIMIIFFVGSFVNGYAMGVVGMVGILTIYFMGWYPLSLALVYIVFLGLTIYLKER